MKKFTVTLATLSLCVAMSAFAEETNTGTTPTDATSTDEGTTTPVETMTPTTTTEETTVSCDQKKGTERPLCRVEEELVKKGVTPSEVQCPPSEGTGADQGVMTLKRLLCAHRAKIAVKAAAKDTARAKYTTRALKKVLQQNIKRETGQMRTDLRQQTQQVRQKVRDDVQERRTQMKLNVQDLRQNARENIRKMRHGSGEEPMGAAALQSYERQTVESVDRYKSQQRIHVRERTISTDRKAWRPIQSIRTLKAAARVRDDENKLTRASRVKEAQTEGRRSE